jgi:hypothetical protein
LAEEQKAIRLMTDLADAAKGKESQKLVQALKAVSQRLGWADMAESVLDKLADHLLEHGEIGADLFLLIVNLLPEEKQRDYLIGG